MQEAFIKQKKKRMKSREKVFLVIEELYFVLRPWKQTEAD
jgi:hypothetical protein